MNKHWMSVYYKEKLWTVETIFYGTKTLILKNSKDDIITVDFKEIDKVTINTWG